MAVLAAVGETEADRIACGGRRTVEELGQEGQGTDGLGTDAGEGRRDSKPGGCSR